MSGNFIRLECLVIAARHLAVEVEVDDREFWISRTSIRDGYCVEVGDKDIWVTPQVYNTINPI